MTATEPTRSFEVEITFDVDADTSLPAWLDMPGIHRVDDADVRPLDALYLDTADLSLARAGYAVRRRTGGPDAGWHIKGPKIGAGRVELHWPLTEGPEDVPADVRHALAAVSEAPLTPLARIRNHRTAYVLRDAADRPVAEFVDDHVIATDLRRDVETTWREWEFELLTSATDGAELLDAARAVAHAAGARPASSASKLARTLGH